MELCGWHVKPPMSTLKRTVLALLLMGGSGAATYAVVRTAYEPPGLPEALAWTRDVYAHEMHATVGATVVWQDLERAVLALKACSKRDDLAGKGARAMLAHLQVLLNR